MSDDPSAGMKSLSTALRVLAHFSGENGTWSVSALCAATGLNKSQVSKILKEFREADLLQQDPRTREYSVGLRAVALAGHHLQQNAIVREAVAPMRRLVDETGQTTTLCILHRGEVLYLLAVEGPHFVEHGWRAGSWVPFHVTAVGQVLAAFISDEERALLVRRGELRRYTPQSVCDPELLWQRLDLVRERGWALTHSEGTPGLGALAVPVFGAAQRVTAALGFVYPEHLVEADQEESYRRKLHGAAATLSLRMGAGVYPFGNAS